MPEPLQTEQQITQENFLSSLNTEQSQDDFLAEARRDLGIIGGNIPLDAELVQTETSPSKLELASVTVEVTPQAVAQKVAARAHDTIHGGRNVEINAELRRGNYALAA